MSSCHEYVSLRYERVGLYICKMKKYTTTELYMNEYRDKMP